METQAQKFKTPNAASRYEVTRKDLPLRCPMPGSRHWDSHPLVFLQCDEHGRARCPYCSAEFILK